MELFLDNSIPLGQRVRQPQDITIQVGKWAHREMSRACPLGGLGSRKLQMCVVISQTSRTHGQDVVSNAWELEMKHFKRYKFAKTQFPRYYQSSHFIP